MKKKTILIIILVLVFIFAVYQAFIKKEKVAFSTEEVSRRDIIKEVSESGTVKMGEEINLSFKVEGKVKEIYKEVGADVKAGDLLVGLNIGQLSIELSEAQAALEVAEAELNKILAGASPEDIKISETSVENAQIALENAQQDLKDIEEKAGEDLESAYQDALNNLDSAYLKIYNSFNTADLIKRTYFGAGDQESLIVKEKAEKIKIDLGKAEIALNKAKARANDKDIEDGLSEMKISLTDAYNSLGIIRETSEAVGYRSTVSSSDKTSLDNRRTDINTALTDVTNDQQDISSTKLANQTNINEAEGNVSSAKGDLKKAEDELIKKKAPPRQVEIDFYQAKARQAEAKVSLLQYDIGQAYLRSPVEGKITKIHKRPGESVQATSQDFVVSLLPAKPFQIEVDIYEEDIVKIEVGNPTDISLVAFPDRTFKGRVISIDPAQKLIDGVVYYEVTIDFEEAPEGLKPGMTADITIETGKRENVLVISKEAAEKIDGKAKVKVFENDEIREREIEIGLEGDEFFEVLSGLEEGEKVVVD